jgi:pre-mRNA-splicing factor CWC22
LENEEKYKSIKAEILGEDSDDESGSEEASSDEDEDEVAETKEGIEDRTETNLVNLRRIIYLTIMNALNYEEAVHKLLKVQLPEGKEIEMCNMIIECCSQERSYSSFYGLIGERFCKLNRVWTDCFESAFNTYYTTVHRYETNRLRNIARFFGHLLGTDSISWVVFECVKINEDDTTSSSRIFVKIMMNEMMESMGLKTLADRFKDPEVKRSCEGMFPMDIPKNTRFAINYFTSIGLGVVTEDMREYLKNAPRLIMEQRRAMLETASSSSSDSSSDSDSSDSSSSDSDSDSDSDSSEDSRRRKRRSPAPSRHARDPKRRSPSPRRRSPSPRRRGPTPSPSPPRQRGRDAERSPDRRRRESPRPGTNGDVSRDHRRNQSPPSPRRARDVSPRMSRSLSRSPRNGRGAGQARSPPPNKNIGRDLRRSRSPVPRKDIGRDARRPRSPPPHRDNGRDRSRSPLPRRDFGRDRSRSPARRDYGRDGRRPRSPVPHRDIGRDSRRSRSPPRKPFGRARESPPHNPGRNVHRSRSPLRRDSRRPFRGEQRNGSRDRVGSGDKRYVDGRDERARPRGRDAVA